MSQIHRNNDLRTCGATTIATQTFVTVAGQAIAVENDQNSHTGGGLIASKGSFIKINNKSVIVVGDNANPDGLCPTLGGAHCAPAAATGASFVTVG